MKITDLTSTNTVNSTDVLPLERDGVTYKATASAIGANARSAMADYLSEVSGGTGCSFYYNDAVCVVRINTSIASPTQDDTTHLKLPSNVVFRYSTLINMCAMSPQYYPIDTNVVLSADANNGTLKIRYQSVPGSSTVLANTVTLPRGWFTIN